MEHITQAADETAADETEAPPVPRPGDEQAYEDSWYQVLRQREAPAEES